MNTKGVAIRTIRTALYINTVAYVQMLYYKNK